MSCFNAKEFLGEYYNEFLIDYESLMRFRKTIKGKPDEYTRAQLELNNMFIDYYKTILFHDPINNKCTCRNCDLVRKNKS